MSVWRTTLFFCLMLLMQLFLAACGNIELPGGDEEENTPSTEQPDDPATLSDTLSVVEALDTPVGTSICVKGYIVGYVSGTSIGSCVFDLPDDVNTNFLIADSPYETSPDYVMPIRLTTKGDNLRSMLNLADHPDFYHALICIRGDVDTYFRVNGIKDIVDYDILGDASDYVEPDDPNDPNDPSDPDDPDNPDNPDNPDDPDRPTTPGIDTTPETIVSGR